MMAADTTALAFFSFLLMAPLAAATAAGGGLDSGAMRLTPKKSSKPPLGWSSWYAFGGCGQVNQTKMEETFEKLVNRSVIPGSNKSLHDVGYQFANLDDGWQDCGKGVNGGFHDKDGFPMMNPVTFPNVTAMTAKAHALGLSPGFYVNNYQCGGGDCQGGAGGAQYTKVMHSTVQWLKTNGFEYLKVDSGGCYNDMQLWHDLLVVADWDITVENCHQGQQPPNATWCPFDSWRVGPDVNGIGPDNEILRVIAAMQTTFPRTGCRPYPDFMSFSSNVNETRSLFGLYAIMGTPMVMSFDIRDDTLLLPRWEILTNEEVLAVNQDETAAVGTLIEMFSPHPADEPEFTWAEKCNASSAAQQGWGYTAATRQLHWSGGLCLDASGGVGSSLSLLPCGQPSQPGAQAWLLNESRLWQAAPPPSEHTFEMKQAPDTAAPTANTANEKSRSLKAATGSGVGSLTLSACAPAAEKPGQQWAFTPMGVTTNVRVNLTTRMGGCWEITGCSFKDGAVPGTTYGCKGLPKSCNSPCDCNGAWSFNAGNKTITSTMSGKCLEKSASGASVEVSACSGKANQQWSWAAGGAGQIQSVSAAGQCIDDGDFPAPPGTDGNCAALTHGDGGDGPGISLVNPGSNGSPCRPANPPKPTEAFVLDDGILKVGQLCVAGRRGKPSPYGPLQLWAKPLADGSVAVLLANRSPASGKTPVPVTVLLSDLPGGDKLGTGAVTARDVWAHADLPAGVVNAGQLTLAAASGQSEFYVLRAGK